MFRISGSIACLLAMATPVWPGEGAIVSMTSRGSLFSNENAQSLFAPVNQGAVVQPVSAAASPEPVRHAARGSLFIGEAEGSFLAPMGRRAAQSWPYGPSSHGTPARRRIRDIIALAEAGSAGYDAVVWAARIKPPKPPSHMTLAEIFDWIRATPNQHHAIGRYQFIPKTLKRLVSKSGLTGSTRFSPAIQDQLADILLDEAGFHAMMAGDMPVQSYQNHLARIWAGLPLENGRSYYQGIAGNKATISRARFNAALANIRSG